MNEGKELERMESLAAEIERNPLTKKFREEEAAATLVVRTKAADRIKTLRDEAKTHVTLQQEIDPLIDKLAALDREREALVAKIRGMRAAFARSKLDVDGEIRQQEEILIATCDPRIDETIQWFQDHHEVLLRKSIDNQTRVGERNIFRMVKEMITFSNAPSLKDTMAYYRAAIPELEAMKLIPTLDADRIEALKRGIPDFGEMREFVGEKPLPKVNTDARCLLKSDEQMDSELGNLNQKFKRVMGR